MSDSFSDYLEAGLLDQLFKGGTAIQPSTVNIALFTANPGEAFSGPGGTSPEIGTTSTAYSRIAVACTASNWTRLNNTIENVSALTYSTASALWGLVTHVGVLDNSNNLLFSGPLNSTKLISSGDVFQFPANDLNIVLN